jgi:hypothetical protein
MRLESHARGPKNGRLSLKGWERQCWSSRAVSGVTPRARLRVVPPALDVLAEPADQLGELVLLLLSRDPCLLVEGDRGLLLRLFILEGAEPPRGGRLKRQALEIPESSTSPARNRRPWSRGI